MFANDSLKITAKPKEINITGIGASPGISIGKAYVVDNEGVDVVERYDIAPDHLVDEINRFKTAVKKTHGELQTLIDSSQEKFDGHRPILQTHQALIKDKMLYGRTIETIEKEKVNAEWALKKVVNNLKSMFKQMDDPYLRERAADVTQVVERILLNLVGSKAINIADIDQRVILVARWLSPAETSQINLERIKGFITAQGGVASHTAIIARTLQIPAVLGASAATKVIQHDDLIIVDGLRGVVVVHPTDETIAKYKDIHDRYHQFMSQIARDSSSEARTADGTNVRIMANIEQPEEVVAVKNHGGDGIGLYRTEFQYMNRTTFPTEDELFEKYRDVVEVMAPKPVAIRTLDINGDKAINTVQEVVEANPALGLRGIRYCLQRPDIFSTQLRAILRAAAYGEVRLLLPMISIRREIDEAQRLLDKAAEDLAAKGERFNRDIKIGIMIEVPAVAIIADIMADKVDFFSIGTNDLIQYTLAIDRGNQEVAHLYHPLHPAVLRLLKRITEVATENKIEVYMCGEMAGDLIYLPVLLGLGINELSMTPKAIPAVKGFIRSLNVDEAKAVTDEVFSLSSAIEIRRLIYERYGDRLSRMMVPTSIH